MSFSQTKNFLLFLITLSSSLIHLTIQQEKKNIIVIPFKVYYPKINDNPNKYYNSLDSAIRRRIYLSLENTNKQTISMIMTMDEPKSHTRYSLATIKTDDVWYDPYNENLEDICNFNYEKSSTYQCVSPYNKNFYTMDNNCCYAKETIKFYTDVNKKNVKNFDYEFVHTTNDTNVCYFGSLQLITEGTEKDFNLLYQIKNFAGSKTYSWTYNFTTPNGGNLIIGDIIGNSDISFDGNYKDNKNKEENFAQAYVSIIVPPTIFWKLSYSKLYIGNTKFNLSEGDIEVHANIDFHSEFITAPNIDFKNMKVYYFGKFLEFDGDKTPICSEIDIEHFFKTVSCKKKEFLSKTNNYKNLGDFNFFSQVLGINITFSAKDLFVEKDDNVYWLIAYNGHNVEDWVFGTLLLEKYNIIFNPDAKQLSVLKYKKGEIIREENNSGSSGGKVVLAIVLTIVFCALVFTALALIFGKKIFKGRKKKANELSDDDFDYTSQEQEKNEQNANENNGQNNQEKALYQDEN